MPQSPPQYQAPRTQSFAPPISREAPSPPAYRAQTYPQPSYHAPAYQAPTRLPQNYSQPTYRQEAPQPAYRQQNFAQPNYQMPVNRAPQNFAPQQREAPRLPQGGGQNVWQKH